MNDLARAPLAGVTVALALLSGCGGNVNLGGESSGGAGSTSEERPPADAPPASTSELVAKLAENFSAGTLAIAGEFLYFSGSDGKTTGLYRCRKDNCERTRERLTQVAGHVATLQVFGQRLGVTTIGESDFWLGSYALPGSTEQQIAIRDLPVSTRPLPLFFGGFVYFSLGVDGGVYRCALPSCDDDPERIASVRKQAQIQLLADGELVFWSDGQFIYRAADYGHGAAQRLLPDSSLSEWPADASNPSDMPADGVVSLTVAEGVLYATVTHSETGESCDSFCPHQMVRWPSGGGPREVLFGTQTMLREVFVFGGELAWVGTSLRTPSNLDSATLSSCRVEACEATRRDLGEVRPDLTGLVADEHDLYWLEAEPPASNRPGDTAMLDRQIRRAARLPPP